MQDIGDISEDHRFPQPFDMRVIHNGNQGIKNLGSLAIASCRKMLNKIVLKDPPPFLIGKPDSSCDSASDSYWFFLASEPWSFNLLLPSVHQSLRRNKGGEFPGKTKNAPNEKGVMVDIAQWKIAPGRSRHLHFYYSRSATLVSRRIDIAMQIATKTTWLWQNLSSWHSTYGGRFCAARGCLDKFIRISIKYTKFGQGWPAFNSDRAGARYIPD